MNRDDVPARIVGIVYGFCPQGCGQTLQVDGIGTVSCYAPSCPRPDSVHLLLQDPETEHVVSVREDGYTTRHPLRERVNDALFSCVVHAEAHDMATEKAGRGELGEYRVTAVEDEPGGYVWTSLGDGDVLPATS